MIKKLFKVGMGLLAIKSMVQVGYAFVKAEYTTLNELGKYAVNNYASTLVSKEKGDSFAAVWAGIATGLTTFSVVSGLYIDTKNPISQDLIELLELLGLGGSN
jgi:hypothetical protein